MPKNHLVSNIMSSSPAKVTWIKGQNGYQKSIESKSEAAPINIKQEDPEKRTSRQKNNLVSTIPSSPQAKVTWEKGPNGYQKRKQPEEASIEINQEPPKKKTRRAQNNSVSITASSSAQAKVTWEKGPNGYRKRKQPEEASIEINQEAPKKKARRAENNSVSITTSSSAPTKVTWKGSKSNSNCKPIKPFGGVLLKYMNNHSNNPSNLIISNNIPEIDNIKVNKDLNNDKVNLNTKPGTTNNSTAYKGEEKKRYLQ